MVQQLARNGRKDATGRFGTAGSLIHNVTLN